MSIRETTDWTTPAAYHPTTVQPGGLIEALRRAYAAFGRARRRRQAERARWRVLPRRAPEVPHALRQDIGLPPLDPMVRYWDPMQGMVTRPAPWRRRD